MALDPNIALGVRPLELPNQLAQYGQLQQIMAAQDAQQMNALKMQEARATMEERNALRQLNPTSPDYEAQLFKLNPSLGISYRKEQSATEASKAATASSLATAARAKQELLGQALRDISGRPSDANITAHTEDIQASPLFSPEEKAKALVTQQTLLAIPFEERKAYLQTQGAKPSDLRPVAVAPGATLVGADNKPVFTAPERADTDLIRNFNAAKAQGFTGTIFDYERKIKEAGRTPAQPVAPTITSIVDPTNPNQMLTIYARRYQSGGVGSPGVIGVAGKEPGAALRTNKTEAGKTQLADDLDNLRTSFERLNEMRAIPSTGRNVVSNLMSATQASGVGQVLGRAGGTEEQVERDVINSARMRLVNSIKNATGMSAQQLNSNVELQTMLKSISDPGQSVEAALRIIDDIENAYVKGDGMLPKRGKPGAAPAAVSPNIDALLKKYEK